MVFSSVLFLFCFLPFALLVYYVSPKKAKNLTLFLVSIVFYAWGEPIYVVLMLFSTVVDFFVSLLIDKYRENKAASRVFIIISIVVNIGLLSVFKYSDFLVNTINTIFGTAIPLPNIGLPIGISFYTFQTLSYTIDVYRNKVKVSKNIIDFGTFVSCFPQLIAGPIVLYESIADQLVSRKESILLFGEGVQRFIIGLGKKVLIANNVGFLWSQIQNQNSSQLSIMTSWLGLIAFGLQIYFDFSGYSDMAIGLGKMFGFHFPENFNYPYTSKSISEFWRRWHISLGTWFREYLYIPLGGNRVGPLRLSSNLMIVWFLTGLWHGASWNFVLWGLYYGVILLFEKIFLSEFLKKMPKFLQHFYTLILVLIAWGLFAFENLGELGTYFKAMFGATSVGVFNTTFIYLLYTNIVVLLIACIGSTRLPMTLWGKTCNVLNDKLKLAISALFLGIVFFICLAYLVNDSYNPFLYFRF